MRESARVTHGGDTPTERNVPQHALLRKESSRNEIDAILGPPEGATLCYHIKEYSVSTGRKREKSKQLFPQKAPEEETIEQQRQQVSAAAEKMLLQDAKGVLRPCELLAIMGPSGAGKTSLLNVLSDRKACPSGYVHVNNWPIAMYGRSKLAYVMQDDLFIDTLTPREHLSFHARLRLPSRIPPDTLQSHVNRLLDKLALEKCANTIIGGPFVTGISGGEKKRLSIATELLGNPCIIFADEPTSGLDSSTAEVVIEMLRALSESGRTVIATIHQPSSYILSLFTHLHLLADGRTVYSGPCGTEALSHFERIGLTCPQHYNPADWFIRVVSKENKESKMTALGSWSGSWAARELELQIAALSTRTQRQQSEEENHSKQLTTGYQASFFTQLRMCYNRTVIMYSREPILTKLRLVQAIFVGILAGLVFLQLENKSSQVQTTTGALFFSVLSQSILCVLGVLHVFPLELPVMLREHAARAYGPGAYFLGKTLAELPIQLIIPCIFATLVYWMAGFDDQFVVFVLFCVFVTLTANTALSMGYAIGSLSKSAEIAMALGPMLFIPIILFGGLFVNVDDIPPYFYWLSYISFIQYGYKGISVAVWSRREVIECDTQPCSFSSGNEVLAYLGFEGETMFKNVLVLISLWVGFRTVALLALIRHCRRPHRT